MSEDVKPEKIKKTQESLSKFIKKPPLTDKLLRKPPFRFLHDIVTAVMRETGFLEGVYSPEELNSENIKDRDGKINFLDKLISNIKMVTGSSISAKPSKIIAGLEVNKTLDLLVALAKAVDIKLNGAKVNEKSSTSKVNEVKEPKKTSKSNRDDKSDASKRKRDDSKGRDKDSKKKPETKTKGSEKKKSEVNKTDNKAEKSEPSNNIEKSQPLVSEIEESSHPNENGIEEKVTESEVSPVENEEKLQGNIISPTKRPTTHKERPPSIDRHSAKEKRSSERRGSSRQNSSDTTSSESKALLERTSSVNIDNSQTEAVVKTDEPQIDGDKRVRLPDKVPLDQIIQISSDSVTNSNMSSDPSDKVNGNASLEVNGDLSSVEPSEKQERKVRVSSVNSRMERYLSAKNEAKGEQVVKQLEKADGNNKAEELPKTVKMKRPQSAKMRPGSSRQRKPEEKMPGAEDKTGQVVLGQGESVDVMGSAPVSAPSAKGKRMLSGRPMSSRPGAPKPKDRGQVTSSDTPSGLEDVKPVILIEDNKDNDDDVENLVTVEKEPVKNDEDEDAEDGLDLNLDESNQGALVTQILETKKELEDTKKNQWKSPYDQRTNVEIDWEARSRSRRDALAKEVKNLRDGIQTVTRSSNPLGKLFDFLQEDVELMQSELLDWTKTNAQLQRDIQLQNKQTEEVLSPLYKQLADLDQLIEHEQESIRRVKSNIYLNTAKLDNLLKINSA